MMPSASSNDNKNDSNVDVDRISNPNNEIIGNGIDSPAESTRSNGNVSEEQHYIGVGFGNNYFGVFGSEALPLLSPSELRDYNINSFYETSEDEESNIKEDEVFSIPPSAFVLPLGGNTNRITQKCRTSKSNDECEQWSAGGTHTCTLHADGEVTMTGTLQGHVFFNKLGRTIMSFRLPLRCTMLASGRRHTIALMEQGAVALSWGSGYFGQLGHGTSYESQPRIITQILPPQLGASHIHTIAAGAYTSAAILHYKSSSRARGNLKGKSRLFVWGSNRWGQCTGRSKSNAVPFPAALDEIWNTNNSTSKNANNSSPSNIQTFATENNNSDILLEDISLGQWHGIVRTSDGNAYIWGKCHDGTSRRRSSVTPPTKLLFGTSQQQQPVEVTQICSGDTHSLFLTMPNNRVYSWGCGHDGQLGLGSTFLGFSTRPRPIMTLAHLPIQKIAAAGNYSVAITENGHLYTWGYGDAHQLGHIVPRDLPIIEPPGGATDHSVPPTQCKGLDSRFNVTVPKCVTFLQDNNCIVENVECGACHLHVLCKTSVTKDFDNSNDNFTELTYLDFFINQRLRSQQRNLFKSQTDLKNADEALTVTSQTTDSGRSNGTKSSNKYSIKRFFCKGMSARTCTSKNNFL